MTGESRRQVATTMAEAADFVSANRTTLAEGDRVIALAGIRRDERFPDPVDQSELQALSDAIDLAAGYDEADH